MLYFVLPICYQFWYARKYTFVQHLPGKQLFAPLAQLAEQVTLNHWVAGSIPARCTLFKSLDSNRRQNFRICSVATLLIQRARSRASHGKRTNANADPFNSDLVRSQMALWCSKAIS